MCINKAHPALSNRALACTHLFQKYINLRAGLIFHCMFLIFQCVSPSVVESFNETQTKATVEGFVFCSLTSFSFLAGRPSLQVNHIYIYIYISSFSTSSTLNGMSIHIVFLTWLRIEILGLSLGDSEDIKICAKFLKSTKKIYFFFKLQYEWWHLQQNKVISFM